MMHPRQVTQLSAAGLLTASGVHAVLRLGNRMHRTHVKNMRSRRKYGAARVTFKTGKINYTSGAALLTFMLFPPFLFVQLARLESGALHPWQLDSAEISDSDSNY